jgi:nucleotide-binding universal stress UspA family protein
MPDPIVVVSDEYLKALANEKKRRISMVQGVVKQVQEALPAAAVTGNVLSGSPGATIIEHARRWKADLIVLGSHGYGRLRRAVLGSVSLSVVLHAPCSVEVVRRPAATAPRRRKSRSSQAR